MESPKNLLWATGGSVAINGALLALLVLTLPKTAAPLPDDTLWVSLETAAETQDAGAPPLEAQPAPPIQPTSQPAVASTPPVPAVTSAQVMPAQVAPSQAPPQTAPAQAPAATPSPAADSKAANSARQAPSSATSPSNAPAPTQDLARAQPQQTAAAGGSKHAASYAARVRAHVESFKVYPPQARRRHQTGTVGFSFTIDRQGRVLSARVTRSSGVPALDQAALDMLAAAQPLPKPPSDLPGEPIGMTSSAEFGLTDE